MCEVLDKVESRGIIRGRTEGKIEAYYDTGLSVREIAAKIHLPEDRVRQIERKLYQHPLVSHQS